MNREKLIAWAREADLPGYPDELERFAAIVATAEREACAELCDKIAQRDETGYGIAEDCAAAIRARGNV